MVVKSRQQVYQAILDSGARLVSIDGTDGVGKTDLARWLEQQNGFSRIELDRFLNKNLGCYEQAIRYEKLQACLSQSLSAKKIVLVDGVLASKILQKISFAAEFNVYVERLTEMGNVYNYDVVKFDADPKASWDESELSSLDRELAEYHKTFRPRSTARVIFQTIF